MIFNELPGMLFKVNLVLLGFLVVATCAPWLRIRHWSVRAFDFPRLQILLLSLALVFLGILQSLAGTSMPILWWLLLVSVVATQLWWIWPYTALHRKEVPGAEKKATDLTGKEQFPEFSVLSCNVLMTNRRSDLLLVIIDKYSPDILAILESDQWWQDQLDILDCYPHRVACPLDNKYGMHLYSKFPLSDQQVNCLVERDVPSISTKVKLPGDHVFHLHIIHPKPPAPGENDFSTARDVELLVLAKALEGLNEPTVVTGDLNDVAWSRTTRLFTKLSQLRDPRVGRGFFNTFHADHWFARWPLDHVFLSPHFQINDIRRLEKMGSDHFPMLVSMRFTHDSSQTDPPSPSESEKALIDDTLNTSVAAKADSLDIPKI